MAVQAFLMAGNHAEIADTFVGKQLLTKQPCSVFNKDWVGGVQLCKGLFIFAFHHHLRFGWNRAATRLYQVLKPHCSGARCHHR